MSVGDGDRSFSYLGWRPLPPLAAETAALCRAVGARVPVFECRLGRSVLANRRAMEELVASVAG